MVCAPGSPSEPVGHGLIFLYRNTFTALPFASFFRSRHTAVPIREQASSNPRTNLPSLLLRLRARRQCLRDH